MQQDRYYTDYNKYSTRVYITWCSQFSRSIPRFLLTLPTRLSSSASAIVKYDDNPGVEGDDNGPEVPHIGVLRCIVDGLCDARGERGEVVCSGLWYVIEYDESDPIYDG